MFSVAQCMCSREGSVSINYLQGPIIRSLALAGSKRVIVTTFEKTLYFCVHLAAKTKAAAAASV